MKLDSIFLPKLDKRVILNSSTPLGQLSKVPVTVKPLSPKNDQHQLSCCNITALENTVVMRITDMITQDEFA